MGRYPKPARAASLKCISCNASVAEAIGGSFVCVECEDEPIKRAGDEYVE